jgi:opacity protein-like surface antigen
MDNETALYQEFYHGLNWQMESIAARLKQTTMLTTSLIKKIFRPEIFIFLLCLISLAANAQVYSNKEVGKKNAELADSLRNSEYQYSLPILGKKAHKAGYNLPYSAGISVNYLWQKSDLVIENLKVGFNNGPMHDLDEVIRFNEAIAEANIINVRPDIWLLPFLNIYGILAVSKPSTSVGFGVWVPDSTNTWKEITSYSTKANFNASTLGFGITPTIGIGGGWLALDMNVAWTDVSALDKPSFTFVIGPRLGKSFKLKKPEQNIAIWAGGFRVKFGKATNGSIALSDVIPAGGEAQQKIDAGQQKVNESQVQVETWWNNLTPQQQSNPVNKGKYETANRALATAGDVLNAAEGAIGTITKSTVQYSLDKRVKDMWNFIVGSQFQLNKHWMLRLEYGFLGSREQLLAGLQYRFGL